LTLAADESETLAADIRLFLGRHGLEANTFGEAAAGDADLLARLDADPASVPAATRERVRAWMAGREAAAPPRRQRMTPTGARDGTFGEFDYDRRIEIYKVLIDSVERAIDRRHALNRFYFSVIVAIFVSISFVVQMENAELPARLIVSSALMLGFLNSTLWLSTIFAARRLSASKYDVICELEEQLDYAPFTREWEIHVAKGRNFPRFTLIETLLPATLSIICLLLFLLIGSGAVALR
jgi:hypothetical protein